MSADPTQLSAVEIRAGILRGDWTPTEVVEQTLTAIEQTDAQVHAFLGVDAEGARARAAELEKAKEPGPLHGVPVALKDNICRQGWEITAGSKILKGFRSPYDATVVQRITEAGGILIGRTNCDEFAMGSSCENSGFGPTRNPWNLECVPGGSSGGSAAAVAGNMVPLSLGSDTGGSIRQPAALTGTVGLKPTYGAVSRYGLIAFASSLDQIGPFARTVEDAALLFQVISGHDPRDSTSVKGEATKPWQDRKDLKGLRIGIPREFFAEEVESTVKQAVEGALETLKKAGAQTVELSLPHTAYAIPTYYLVCTAEASSNLARYDGTRYGLRAAGKSLQEMYGQTRDEGFGEEVKRRILLGTYALSSGYYDAYYKKALQVRTLLKRDFEKAFAQCDLIAGPTSPVGAFRLGEKVEDPLAMYLCDIFTTTANLVGLPGISIPCGLTGEKLPVGLQLLGPAFAENRLFETASYFEKTTGFPRRSAT